MRKSCPYCWTDSPLYLRSRDYNRRATQEVFDHYRCPRCHLIFMAPIPPNLGGFYPEEYHPVPDSQARLAARSASDQYKIEIVQRFVKKGRLLEIGPSYGGFTYLAKKAGFEVDAIEMDERCCRFLNEVLDVRSINSAEPIKVLQQGRPYDVIALWHVIEHLADPWKTMDAIYSCLNPGAIVVLASPNPESVQFRMLRARWPHLDAPRHLMLIPMRVLREKMSKLGMTIELATTRDPGSIRCNAYGWEGFFVNASSQDFIKKQLHRLGRLVKTLFVPVDQVEGWGSAYTMVFRKA